VSPAEEASDPASPGQVDGSARGTDPDDLTERVIASEVIYRGHHLEFRIDSIERADGSLATREIVGHPGAVAIVALDEADRVLLVRQFRVAAGQALLEIPAGTLDVDAATGTIEDPDTAAARELEEETGYRADEWRRLASFWTAPGFATELMHLYFASGLRPAHEGRLGPDDDERLQLERIPWRDAVASAERGEFADAKSMVGLLWLGRSREVDTTPAPEPEPGAKRVVEATFPMRIADVVRANMAYTRNSRGAFFFALILGLSAAVAYAGGDLIWPIVGSVFLVSILTGVVVAPFVWFQMRKRPELFEKRSKIQADERGLRYVSSLGSGVYAWSSFKRVRERGGFFFLDSGIGSNIFVPVRAFDPEALARFRRLLLDAGFSPDGHPVRPR